MHRHPHFLFPGVPSNRSGENEGRQAPFSSALSRRRTPAGFCVEVETQGVELVRACSYFSESTLSAISFFHFSVLSSSNNHCDFRSICLSSAPLVRQRIHRLHWPRLDHHPAHPNKAKPTTVLVLYSINQTPIKSHPSIHQRMLPRRALLGRRLLRRRLLLLAAIVHMDLLCVASLHYVNDITRTFTAPRHFGIASFNRSFLFISCFHVPPWRACTTPGPAANNARAAGAGHGAKAQCP